MADGTFRSLLSALGPSKPNPVTTGTTYGRRPTLLGGVNPLPSGPDYTNPLGKKKPQTATPIPGVTGYGSGMKPPPSGRSTLLGR